MSNPKILILIKGGSVQAVHATEDINYVIVDYDNVDNGENPVSKIYDPDVVFIPGLAHTDFTDESDPQDMEIKDELKRLNF